MPSAIPIATYRLQLSGDFGFDDAAKLVPTLKALGVSHLYASPFLKARKGSSHGYDIVDHATLNPEFGGEAAFLRLSNALKDADLGLILDFVPNHMGINYADNGWWLDVLEWGRQSPHAADFDISWDLLPYRQSGGVLLPALGESYGDALGKGDIALKYDAQAGSFSAWYFEHRFPINPHRYGEMIKLIVASADATDEPAGRALIEVASRHPRPRSPSYAQAPDYKRAIAAVPGGAEVIERGLSAYRSDSPAGLVALHRLLERQNYRLASWRLAVSGINYRRFFDVNDLAGLRIENPATFRAAHVLVARLIAEDRLQGLRIDHIDGLRDPMQYARRLRQLVRQIRGPRDRRPFHVTVEKILAEREPLAEFAGVDGTTGYEWLNVITRVLVDDRGLEPLDAIWRGFTGEQKPFETILEEAKRRVLDTMLASEFTVLTQLLSRIAAGHYSTRDYGPDRLRAALELYVIKFPIYRTYVATAGASDSDRAMIDQTITAARAHWPGPDPEIFDFIRDALTLDLITDTRAYSEPRVRDLALRFQQFTGPMMAKSLEDTTFYRHHRLLALNEVGGEPIAHGLSVEAFHERMQDRANVYRHGLTATTTHDTKRGEDGRTRILALAEQPQQWGDAVTQWAKLNTPLIQRYGNWRVPSRAHEYMIYQALIGVWPQNGAVDDTLVERVCAYAVKAAREGKQQTSWVNPDKGYEDALQQFVRDLLDPASPFLELFVPFARRCALVGAWGSLAQVTLKTMMPGVPDFYQGTEFWDTSLVDPDNRRPPPFAAIREAMTHHPHGEAAWRTLGENWRDGRIKLALTQKLLTVRNAMPSVFQDGRYEPVIVEGANADNVVAFVLAHGKRKVFVAVARHLGPAATGDEDWLAAARHIANWDATLRLDGADKFRDALDVLPNSAPASFTAAALFPALPVAVLTSG